MTMERQTTSTNSFAQFSVVGDTSASIPSLNAEPVPMLSDIVVQEEEVLDQIKILDCNKSYGPFHQDLLKWRVSLSLNH